MTKQTPQMVYVLTNPAMPGLIQIGKTTQQEIKERMKQLYSTGVPVPFNCVFACQVKDAKEVEDALKFAFDITVRGVGGVSEKRIRINPNREFFEIEPERVIAVLRLLMIAEITVEVEKTIESDLTDADKQSAKKLKQSRRPILNYTVLKIPVGSILVSTEDPTVTVKVLDERKVEFEGYSCFLAVPTRKVLKLPDDYSIQPSPYWTYNGKNLKDIYEEAHSSGDEV
jgi:hypothetical protein